MGQTRGEMGRAIAPLRWCLGPDDLQSAGGTIAGVTGAKAVGPTEPLLLQSGALGGRTQLYISPISSGLREGERLCSLVLEAP